MKNLMMLALAAVVCASPAGAQTVDSVITNALFEPHSVAVDGVNNLYVTDGANNRIVRYASDTGLLRNISGGTAGERGYVEGIGIIARYFDPKGIVFDPVRGELVVADSGNHSIRLVTTNGTSRLLAGGGGEANFGNTDGLGAAARFSSPAGLAVDTNGVVFVADTKNHSIRRIDLSGNVTTLISTGLYEPAAVAVGANGDIWVADTRNHTIRGYSRDGVADPKRIIGSNSRHVSGFQDSLFGGQAIFNNPRGLLWLGGEAGLLVSDTGNHVLRRIFFNADVNDYSVEIYAGTPGQAGTVNAALLSAKFNSPVGLANETVNNGFLIVDTSGSALRRIQTSPPRPPVSNPVIGWVDIVKDSFGDPVSVLVPVTQSVFTDDVTIAILTEAGTETFFTFGATPPNPLDDKVPYPSRATGQTPVPYENGLRPNEVGPSIIAPLPDVIIKAISTQDGRRPSGLVQARFQFKTGNPVIIGDNSQSFVVNNETRASDMYYTTDGTDPAPGSATSVGPVSSGTTISLQPSPTNILFKIRAFRPNFKDSEIISKTFSPTNFVPNRISFGFEAGEASSQFIASPGQRFYAPVTMRLLTGQAFYSLQFNLGVTNKVDSHQVAIAANNRGVDFEPMLKMKVPGENTYYTIHPEIFKPNPRDPLDPDIPYDAVLNPPGSSLTYINSPRQYINTNSSLMLIAWTAVRGNKIQVAPPLEAVWDTALQDLTTYSIAHDTVFLGAQQDVVVGGYSFVIPPSAAASSQYEIAIGRPSGTSDGVGGPGGLVYIQSPTNGALRGIQTVRVGQNRYTVGDVAPFRWFNAGDFGNSNLLSDDVMQVYRSAVYRLNMPPGSTSDPRSDFFDAMDASGGAITNLVLLNRVQTNLTLFTTNYFLVTNTITTNITFITTNLLDTPNAFDLFYTNQVVSTNLILTNISVVPGIPVYQTNQVLVTNEFLMFQRYLASGFTNQQVVTTNTGVFTSEIVTTNRIITPGQSFIGWLNILVTNVYVQGTPIPTNGFLVLEPNPNLLLSDGSDTVIDSMALGDGELNVDDVYVTLRRSLDPARTWYQRFWQNGTRVSVPIQNRFPGSPNTPARRFTSVGEASATPLPAAFTEPPLVTFSADDIHGAAGQTIDIPIRARIQGGLPVRALMLNLNVVALDGSPQISTPVELLPAPGLANPTVRTAVRPGNVSAAWLGANTEGVAGAAVVALLRVRLPDSATDRAAYRVEFEHASASPNGVGLFPKRIQHGLVLLGDRTKSTWSDAIPDHWRLRHFGSLGNVLSHPDADADGDGVPNVAEYRAGTTPTDVASVLKLRSERRGDRARGVTLRWPTTAFKRYILESSDVLAGGEWTPVAENLIGTGRDMEFSDAPADGQVKFYRVRLAE